MEMDPKLIESLKDFGLSEKEAKVYVACLQTEAPAFDVAVRADVPRTLTYDILERLIELGLVSHVIRDNKKFFRASHPNKFLEILKEKQDSVQNVLKTLTALYDLDAEERAKVKIYEGIEGLKTIHETILKSGVKEYHAIGGSAMTQQLLPYYIPHFYTAKKEKGIHLFLLFYDTKKARERAKELQQLGLVTVKFMKEKVSTPISMYIFGNYTALLILSSIEPLAILIDSKYVTQGFRTYFHALWEAAKS